MTSYSSGRPDTFTLSASGDQNDSQYKFVQGATTAGLFLIATGTSGPEPLGVLQNDPKTGDAGLIMHQGITQLWIDAAAAVAYMDFVTCGSDGRGVVSATAGSNNFFGIALAAVASGSALIPVLLRRGQVAADNTP